MRSRGFPFNGTFKKFLVKPSQSRAGKPFYFYERITVPLIPIFNCELFRGRDQVFFMYVSSEPNQCLAQVDAQ